MPHARQHLPGWVSGFEPEQGDFETKDELLAMPWVKSWEEAPDFYRWSISPYYHQQWHLMCELRNGTTWWVIATLDADLPELPRWVPPSER